MRIKLKIFILLTIPLFFINSCIYVPLSNFNWYKIGEPSKEIKYIKVSNTNDICRELGAKTAPSHKIIACAVYTPELCSIFTEYEKENIPDFIKKHEELHCSGYNHD